MTRNRLAAACSLVVLLTTGTAAAQDRDQQLKLCRDTSGDAAISACTTLIRSGQLTPEKLAYALASRGSHYLAKDQYDLATADFDQALRLDPTSVGAYLGRAFAYFDKGKYDRAIADFDQALRLDPTNADAYASRGVSYGAKGQYDRAIADFDQALRLDPNNDLARTNRDIAFRHKHDR